MAAHLPANHVAGVQRYAVTTRSGLAVWLYMPSAICFRAFVSAPEVAFLRTQDCIPVFYPTLELLGHLAIGE